MCTGEKEQEKQCNEQTDSVSEEHRGVKTGRGRTWQRVVKCELNPAVRGREVLAK